MSHKENDRFYESLAEVMAGEPSCQYPGCTKQAEPGFLCCDSRHGLALRQLKESLTVPTRRELLLSANWRKGVLAQNVLGDRFEEKITFEDLIQTSV